MKMRNMVAAFAALAVSAVCVAAVPASAADVAYTESAGSLSKGDDGVSLRRNIYNVWGNEVRDIDGEGGTIGAFDSITVNFTVSGIGTDSVKTNSDDTTEPLYVFLGGSIAGQNAHQKEYDDGAVTGDQVAMINGDGDYSVTWTISSDSISCLYLQSNINFYAYGENVQDVADTTANIKVTSITTVEPAAEETTTAEAETTTTAADGTTTTAAGTTTTAAGTTTTAKAATTTTTAAAGGSASTTTAAAATTNTNTGDNSGIAVAVAALAVAGGVALVTKKNNK